MLTQPYRVISYNPTIMEHSSFFQTSITDLIRKRYSCRTYQKKPIEPDHLAALDTFITNHSVGPFGNQIRCMVTSAGAQQSTDFRKLGTYGFIKDPAGFVIGINKDEPHALVDLGYCLELVALKATELGIGSCWLGGTFTKSRFSKISRLEANEDIPSVLSIGYPEDRQAWIDRAARIYAGADRRLPWQELFFDESGDPLPETNAGDFQTALEMVRLAPSASNKQPWRVLKANQDWQFYLERTPKYPSPVITSILGLADLQVVDLGIALAHFDLTVHEMGKKGSWKFDPPDQRNTPAALEYIATWKQI